MTASQGAGRVSLSDFQKSLAERLADAERGAGAATMLAIDSGGQGWLLELAEAGEVVPLPPLFSVPLTKSWYAGLANVRGNLYSVVDLAAFLGGPATARDAESRLLLVGARHGINSALLIAAARGLKNVATLHRDDDAPPASASWIGEAYRDGSGQRWTRLDLAALLKSGEFLDVGL